MDVLESDLDDLETRAAFLANLCASGGNIQYYVSWFASDRSGGVTISFRQLQRLAALQVSVALDVYSMDRPGGEGERA